MSWSRAFHVPITTPDGLMLRTLRDAGEYIQALPRAGAGRARHMHSLADEVALGVGMAAQRLKPVGEIQFMGFLYPSVTLQSPK